MAAYMAKHSTTIRDKNIAIESAVPSYIYPAVDTHAAIIKPRIKVMEAELAPAASGNIFIDSTVTAAKTNPTAAA